MVGCEGLGKLNSLNNPLQREDSISRSMLILPKSAGYGLRLEVEGRGFRGSGFMWVVSIPN